MFITTANTLSGIPVPLQDRMEIIQLSGYTEFEKLNIAVKYLVPRQKKECGLEDVPFTISENALRTVDPPLHARGRRALARARAVIDLPQGGAAGGRGAAVGEGGGGRRRSSPADPRGRQCSGRRQRKVSQRYRHRQRHGYRR